MQPGRTSLLLQILSFTAVTTLGIATGYLTNRAGDAPSALLVLQRGSLPVAGLSALAAVSLIVWQHYADGQPGTRRPRWDPARSPFPGLRAFGEADTDVFFGREREIGDLVARLHPALPRHASRFLPVIGASGVGKSSLIEAGLVPRLVEGRSRWVVPPSMTPGDAPFRQLASVLAERDPDFDTLAAALAHDPDALPRQLGLLRAARSRQRRPLLIVIDQTEELLTLTSEEQRTSFLALLEQAVERDPHLWVIMALRSEFLGAFLATSFAHMFQMPIAIGPLEAAALTEVIERPAKQVGLAFDPPLLVQTMAADAGGGDGLPLLAFTLQNLYLAAGPAGRVTAHDYELIGGVAGAINSQAAKVTVELHRIGIPTDSILQTLLKFVSLTGEEATSRPLFRRYLDSSEQSVVDGFVEARLMISEGTGADALVRVAHEALFRRWPPLRERVEARAEDLRQRSDLERWAEEWKRSGRQSDFLLRDRRLAAARQWAANNTDVTGLQGEIREFLEQSARADRATMSRLADAIANQALATLGTDPERSVMLSVAAIEQCASTPLARRALMTSLIQSRVESVLKGHTGTLLEANWSPNGDLIASASDDGTVRIWNPDGTEKAVLRGHEDTVFTACWSPTGALLATTSYDGTARVWDPHTGTPIHILRGHGGRLRDGTWSPDGLRLATASDDRTARIWDVRTGSLLHTLRGHDDRLRAVSWSPDGLRLATASDDRTASIWNPLSNSLLHTLRGHQGQLRHVAWSPDGALLATACTDGTVCVWDAAEGSCRQTLRGHENWVRRVVWSPDGKRLASASADTTARIWNVADGATVTVLKGHDDAVWNVAWSPDGTHLATSCYDDTAAIWDPQTGERMALLLGHNASVRTICWSPDGHRVVTASQDNTARVWHADRDIGPSHVRTLKVSEAAVWDVAWSPDGSCLATASDDPTPRLWRIGERSGDPEVLLHGHEDGVRGVAWSPDGARLATTSYDRTARIWDAVTGTQLAVLEVESQGALWGIAWSPDGQCLATGSSDRTAQVWDASDGKQLVVMRGHLGAIRTVAWSPGAPLLVTASADSTCRIWDTRDGRVLRVLEGHNGWIWSAAWSPDGTLIATASADTTVRLWDAGSGREVAVLRGHSAAVRAVSWSPDCRHVATASFDQTMRIWRVADGEELIVGGVHRGKADAVAWSPTGDLIATGSHDHTAQVWDAGIRTGAMLSLARQRMVLSLTEADRRALMLPSTG